MVRFLQVLKFHDSLTQEESRSDVSKLSFEVTLTPRLRTTESIQKSFTRDSDRCKYKTNKKQTPIKQTNPDPGSLRKEEVYWSVWGSIIQ